MQAETAGTGGCPRCVELERRVAALEAQLAAAKKNSSTSSKPPSSDLVKPPKARKQRGQRKRGAQPGHPRQRASAVRAGRNHARGRASTGSFRTPQTSEAQNLANRFHKHGREYLRFITTPGVEPTNNLAEQAIRFVVLDRKVTQGTRSPAGRKWCERIWTAIATCTQHGRNVLAFLTQSVQALFTHSAGPSLLPESS